MLKNDDQSPQKTRMNEILAIKDEKERYRQIAIWTTEFGWDEIVYTKSPLPPLDLEKYRGLNYLQKSKIDSNFFQRDDIKIFMHRKWIFNLRNLKFFEWLNTLVKWLNPETDIEKMKLVRNKINEFETAYRTEKERPYPVLNPFYEWPKKAEETQEFA